jgi:hypothetical protein
MSALKQLQRCRRANFGAESRKSHRLAATRALRQSIRADCVKGHEE